MREHGVDPGEVFGALDLEPAHFEEPEHRIPLAGMGALLQRCADRCGCPHFSLLVAKRTGVSSLGAVGFLVRSAPDVRTALGLLTRYFHLHNRSAAVAVTPEGDFVALSYRILEAEIEGQAQILDGAMAVALNLMRTLCGGDWLPTQVRFAHASPPDPTPFRQIFRAPPLFDAEETALVFPSTWLDRPTSDPDPLLHRIMLRHVSELDDSGADDLVARLPRLLPSLVRRNQASLAAAAHRLGLPIRTLNRRLAEEDRSFRQLLDEAHFAAACQLLAGTHLQAAEIASLLGYANPGGFTRAFSRWAGVTPARWRVAERPHTRLRSGSPSAPSFPPPADGIRQP